MLCIRGILGKGTLRTYPFSRVPTEHIERLVHNNKIEQRFRMPLSEVNYLIDALRKPFTVSVKNSVNSTLGNEPIYPEVIVLVGLRF